MSKEKVERQKGPIKADQPTYRTLTHPQKVVERAKDLAMLRSAQTLTLHVPKTGKK